MKKIYLIDLEKEKRDYLIKLNTKLMEKLQNELYENNMELQYIDSRNILNDEALNAIDYHDNYNSFYYTLNNWRKFIINIDKDYLSEEAQKNYNIIINKINVFDSMDYHSENYERLENYLEKLTEKVLEDIETLLHSYEEYPSIDDAILYAEEMERLTDYYIEQNEDGTSDNVIRLDVAFTETYI